MKTSHVRVRFAPAPTGFMHLGNIRTALLNYVFAKKHHGTFIIRIEDTDPERNIDPQATRIVSDLLWLSLEFDEGPIKGGDCAPYFQSQRNSLYQQKLEELQTTDLIYRCFCTPEELEKKRQRQIALKMPPRYDRACLQRSQIEIDNLVSAGTPFIWRLKVKQDNTVTINDLAHGTITFNLKDFSDIPLTRADGSFTFIFANCVDDILMRITHVIRGEDHLTNTAAQTVLYQSFNTPVPIFWHLPIICNAEGKKLSKRDFGFSLNDLKESGYLPEAIVNYLGIIGASFEQEILSLSELVQAFNTEHIRSTGQIKYDIEKLNWVNHQWITRIDTATLTSLALPFLIKQHPQAASLPHEMLHKLIEAVKTNLVTLDTVATLLAFYFVEPTVTKEDMLTVVDTNTYEQISTLIKKHLSSIDNPDHFVTALKTEIKGSSIAVPALFSVIRLMLTGSQQGLSIKELLHLLGPERAAQRIRNVNSV